MSLQVEKLEHNMAKLTIEVDAAEFEKAIEDAYKKNKNKISIPGFRKGKASRAVIEKLYGKNVFYEDAANAIIPEAYEKELANCEEEIVSQPRIDVVQIEAGKNFIFTAEVALKPEVTLGKYKGVKIDKIDVTVSDEEVEAELQKELEKNAREITVEDRAVQMGDTITFDFDGYVDGEAFEGGKAEDHELTIGSGKFIPGFEDQLVGAKIGEALDVVVTFPEDYYEQLAGKEATFKCLVKGIKAKEYPALDDEFAQEVSEFDTLKEYKASIKNDLEDRKVMAAKDAKEEAVVNAIIADAKMDIPDAMVETQQRQMIDEFAQRMQAQNVTLEAYMQMTGTTVQMLMEQVKPQAMLRIQSRLVLEEVVKAENIVATDEEFEDEVQVMAATYQLEADKVKGLLGESGAEQVKQDICIKKAVAFAVENAKESKPRAKKAKAEETTSEEA